MNDTTKPAAPEVRTRKPAENKVTVTLTRGTDYSLLFGGDTYRFKQGEAKAVPEAVAEHLKAHAVDLVTVEEQAEPRAKFLYEA